MNYYRVISLASFLAVASLAAQTPSNLESFNWFSKISQNIAAGEYNISPTPLNAREWQKPKQGPKFKNLLYRIVTGKSLDRPMPYYGASNPAVLQPPKSK